MQKWSIYIRQTLLLILLAISPLAAHAHGYWIELVGNHKINEAVEVRLYYGDYPEGERLQGKYLEKMKDIKVYVRQGSAEQQPITMTRTNDYWTGSFVPNIKTTYEITGINNVREVQDWTRHHLGITRPIQYLKAYYTIGKKVEAIPNTLYLNATITPLKKRRYTITLTKDGVPLPKQEVCITAYGTDAHYPDTDENGQTTVELQKKGLYILSVDWVDKTPGTFHNKKYETVRHRLDYSFYIN